MKKRIVYLAICILQCSYIHATQLIQGDVSPTTATNGCPVPATTTFKNPVHASAYDRANGILWVGLTAGASNYDANQYAVSTFQRLVDTSQPPQFQPRATSSILNNQEIALLTMATSSGDTCSKTAGVILNSNEVFVVNLQNKAAVSSALKAYNSTLNEDGSTSGSIVAIAANSCFSFAAVTPSSGSTFGDTNSGIAVVYINPATLALNQTAAVPGDSGIKAQQLDNSSPFIRIGSSNTRIPGITGDRAILVWDDQLERLYIGVSLQSTSVQLAGDGLRSIVLAQVTGCPQKGELPLFDFAPAGAFTTDQNNLVGVVLETDAQELALTVSNLAVMHASTGPSYLILNGGNGTATNQIFALPLVDRCNPSDPVQGQLADKNSFNSTTHHFEQPAQVHADLTTSADMFAQVGAGPLPIQSNQVISGMMVIEDAVYVSFKIPQDSNNETGILYSQALFDSEGRINSWTPWTKRVWPICGFPDSPSSSQVSFFAVDAVTGKVIAVDGSPQTTVRITEWDRGGICCDPCSINCSLAAVLNRSLCNGCYTALDLDQSTTGIGESIPYRYALFGGTNKVDFALTSSSRATGAPFNNNPITNDPYPQLVTIDYCCPSFFQETELPPDAGCVTTLEYSRRPAQDGNSNYFFAGTQHGLFVFAHQDGTGFNVQELGPLNEGIMQTGSWQHIPIITGAVTDIKSSGNALYVLTFTTGCETPFASTLQRIDFADNVVDMFNPNTNIFTIAQSGTSPTLQATLMFTAIDILQTTEDGSVEQLVLATNNGIFQSNAINGIQQATNQNNAQWTNLQCSTLFYGIGSVDNARIKSTDWPFSAQDACGCRTFERSCIHQLNSSFNPTEDFAFVPSFFNHITTCCSNVCESQSDQPCCCFPQPVQTPCEQATTACGASCYHNCCVQTNITNQCCRSLKLFEKICYFWSDGGRRFFIIAPTNSKIACMPCKVKQTCGSFEQLRFLEVTPFNTCVWNVHDPLQTVLHDCALLSTPAFYWVQAIGMTGIVLTGTPSGVVALE